MPKNFENFDDILNLTSHELENLDDDSKNVLCQKGWDFWSSLLPKTPTSLLRTLVSIMGKERLTPLFLNNYNKFFELVQTLNPEHQNILVASLDLNFTFEEEDEEEEDINFLNFVIRENRIDIANLLFPNTNSIDLKDHYGYTPLIVAAVNGYREIVEMLFKYNVNLNAQDNTGNSALDYTVYKGHYEVALLLLKQGADLDLKKHNGLHPRQKITEEEQDHYKTFVAIIKKYSVARKHNPECATLILDAYMRYIKNNRIHKMSPTSPIHEYNVFLANAKQQALMNDINALFDLLTASTLEEIQENFALLCQHRDKENKGSLLHFTTNPFTHSNDLYFKIAKQLHPTASFLQLLNVLMPHITHQWVPKITDHTLTLEKKDIAVSDVHLQIELESFSHMAFTDSEILIMDFIETFSREEHQKLSELLLQKNPALHKEVTFHNETTLGLYFNPAEDTVDQNLEVYRLRYYFNEEIDPELAANKTTNEKFPTLKSHINVQKNWLGISKPGHLPAALLDTLYPRLFIRRTYNTPKLNLFLSVLPTSEYKSFILNTPNIFETLTDCPNEIFKTLDSNQRNLLINALIDISFEDKRKHNDCVELFLDIKQFDAFRKITPNVNERIRPAQKHSRNMLLHHLIDIVTESDLVAALEHLPTNVHIEALSKENKEGVSALSYHADKLDSLKMIIEALSPADRLTVYKIKSKNTSEALFESAIKFNPAAREILLKLLPNEDQPKFLKMTTPNYYFSFWASMAAGVGFFIGACIAENQEVKAALVTAGATLVASSVSFFSHPFVKTEQSRLQLSATP